MKCASCKESIDTKFQAALRKNECPFCGMEIMPDKLRVLLEDFKILFSDASEFPDEVAEYLSTNFGFHKLSDDELRRAKMKNGALRIRQEGDEDGDEGDGEELSQFAKNAGIKTFKKRNPIKTVSDYTRVISEIQNEDEEAGSDMSDEERLAAYDSDIGPSTGSSLSIGGDARPLSGSDAQQLSGLFDDGPNPIFEAERLRSLRRSQMMSGEVKVKRRDD